MVENKKKIYGFLSNEIYFKHLSFDDRDGDDDGDNGVRDDRKHGIQSVRALTVARVLV